MAATGVSHFVRHTSRWEKPMRKSLLAAAAALSIVGMGGGALMAYAQPAPPSGPATAAEAAAPPAPGPRWMHHDREAGRQGMRHRRSFTPGTFRLFFHPADRQLTPDDVQKIAEAFLLWNGNHTWKVIDVAAGSDNQISFAYAAPDNTVIARFSMDPHTGRLTRTG